jgi:hypothetical protein
MTNASKMTTCVEQSDRWRTSLNDITRKNHSLHLVTQSFSRSLSNDPALIQDRYDIRDRFDFVQQVRAVNHRSPFGLQMFDQVPVEFFPRYGIEPECRVVENRHLR